MDNPNLPAPAVSPAPAVPAAAASATPPQQASRWDWRAEVFRPAMGLLVAGIVPLLLVFANTQVKGMIDHFLDGCVFVLDKQVTQNNQFLVRGFLSGNPPKSMPLRFEAKEGTLNYIIFDEIALDLHESENLARHPLQGLTCPGELCPEEEKDSALHSRKVIALPDMKPEFSYNFLVLLNTTPADKPREEKMLSVAAIFPSGLEGGVCRVESRQWFNFWVWASTLQKTLLFLFILVCGGLVLRWARSTGSTT